MVASTQALFDDEFTREVRDAYVRLRVQGTPCDEAIEVVLYDHRYTALMSPAHAALLWLALAVTQWQNGELREVALRRASAVIADDQWIALWSESPAERAWRRAILETVRADLASPSPAVPPIEVEPLRHVVPLDDDDRSRLASSLTALRAKNPEMDFDAPPETIVREVARQLDDARAATLTEPQRAAIVLDLGTVWGAQLARLEEWEWAHVIDASGDDARSLVLRNRTAFVSPYLHCSWSLEDPEANSNIAQQLFEAIRDGSIPRAIEPGALLSLRDFAYRLSDPKWPEQRAQLLNGAAHPEMAGSRDVDELACLDEMAQLSDTSSCTASSIVIAESDAGDPCPPPGPPPPAVVARRALVLRSLLDHTVGGLPRELLARYASGWDPADRARFAPEAQALSRQRVEALHASGLWTHAECEEQAVLQTPFTELEPPQLIATSWRAESLACLLWALGRLDTLPPYDESVNGEVLLALSTSHGGDGFVLAARLRPHEEIERARTIAELWHWRSRTRQLLEEKRRFPGVPGFPVKSWDDVVRYTAPQAVSHGFLSHAIDDDFPAFGRPYRDLTPEEWAQARSIAMERHFALNWLCGYAPGNRWSETPTET